MKTGTLAVLVLGFALGGCHTSHEIRHDVKVEPTEHTIRVEPIKVDVDINLKLEVERELEDLFDFREDRSEVPAPESGEGGAE